MSRSELLRILPLLLVPILSPHLLAQSTQAEIPPPAPAPYLRGLWRGEQLHFDASGHKLGDSTKLAFTLSGVDVRKVTFRPDKPTLEGRRIGVEFQNEQAKRVPSYERR